MHDASRTHLSPEWAEATLASVRARVDAVVREGDRLAIGEELVDLRLLHDAIEKAACELVCEARDLGGMDDEAALRSVLRGFADTRWQLVSDLADQAGRLEEFAV